MPPPREGAAFPEPGERLGPYTIAEPLGRGQVGAVFRAEGPPGEVALKILHPGLAEDASYRRRFEREGEIARALDHPHLLPVVDHGEAPLDRQLTVAASGTRRSTAAGPVALTRCV